MSDNSVDRLDFKIDDIIEEARQKKLERLKKGRLSLTDDIDSGRSLAGNLDTLLSQKKKPLKSEIFNEYNENLLQNSSQSSGVVCKADVTGSSDNNTTYAKKAKVVPPKTATSTVHNQPGDNIPQKTVDDATRQFNIEKRRDQVDDEQVKVYQPKSQDDLTSEPVQQDDFDQIMLDSLLGDLPKDSDFEQAENWEEKLKRERKKKAESFKLQPPVALRLSGEEEENDPSEEPDNFVDEEIEDYCSYDDTEAVRSELNYRRRTGLLQLVLSGMFAITLVGFAVVYYLQWTSINPVLYVGLNVFLLSVAVLVNHRSVGDGLGALIRLDANVESMTSLLVILSIIHTLLQFLNPEVVTGSKADIFAPVAATTLFFSALGRQMLISRVYKNFKFVSYKDDKYAAHIIEDRKMANEIGRAAVALGDPVVCYVEKTDFLTRFLENSYEANIGKKTMRVYTAFVLGMSLLIGVLYAVFSGSVMNSLTVFVSAICVATPAGALTAINYPLLRTAKRGLRHGAMIVGWQAAEQFGDVHALVADALEVFPSESVLLHGIKTFSGARIDDAILDAAAVSIAAGGPLSSVFRRVIQNRTDILREVDTLIYEYDMGMSGWVGRRRVLVGNRRLLENHGVDVPSRDFELRYVKGNRQIVYLSTAGELSAMFIISYTPDEGIKKALKCLCGAGITLLVRTCDPNVTEELICDTYELDPYYVEVLGAAAGRNYEQLRTLKSDENEAILASNGRLEGTAIGVGCCCRLYNAVRLGLIVQVIGGALGISLAVFWALYAGIMIQPLHIIAYLLLWTLLSWITLAFFRV